MASDRFNNTAYQISARLRTLASQIDAATVQADTVRGHHATERYTAGEIVANITSTMSNLPLYSLIANADQG